MKFLYVLLGVLISIPVYATDVLPLSAAIENARAQCGDISVALMRLKTMAGINTAVTAVGTASGGVALGVGIAKAQTDTDIVHIEEMLARYKNSPNIPNNPKFKDINWDVEKQKLEQLLADTYRDLGKDYAGLEQGQRDSVSVAVLETAKEEFDKRSVTLGNIRTGTMAASTATNIAGAVIADKNHIDDELNFMIDSCVAAVDALSAAKMAAHVGGTATVHDTTTADMIIAACGKWETVDLSKIDRRAHGAMVSSAIGAATGGVGTIASGVANSKSVRDGDAVRERNLNTASNVLAGATTAASGAATIFNVTQIRAIKSVVEIADECEGVLK